MTERSSVAELFNLVDTSNGLQTSEADLWWTGDDRGVFKVNKA